MNSSNSFTILCIIYLATLFLSCGASRRDDSIYKDVWEDVVNSPEWQNSLDPQPVDSTAQHDYLPLGAEEKKGNVNMDKEFIERYHSLVNQAYFRLITQAEEADQRIAQAYKEARKEYNQGLISGEALEKAKERYKAHAFMLDGLKSWKAFKRERTADMEFFKAENIIDVYDLVQAGESENAIIEHLMLELADLYHIEERGFLKE